MRILGLVLALGAIVWVMMQAADGGDGETVISQGHQDALKKAQGMEQVLMDKAANAAKQPIEDE